MGLEFILEQVKCGAVSPARAISGIETYNKAVERSHARKYSNIMRRLEGSNGHEYCDSAEKEFFDYDRQFFVAKVITEIKEIVGERNFNNMLDYTVDRKTYQQIAEEEGTSKQAVQQRVTLNFKKVAEILEEKYGKENILNIRDTSNYEVFYCGFDDHVIRQKTSGKRSMLPFEDRTNVKLPRKKQHVCYVKEDLEKAFGDKDTVCTYCNKCQMKEGN